MRHLLPGILLLLSACTISYSGYEEEEDEKEEVTSVSRSEPVAADAGRD